MAIISYFCSAELTASAFILLYVVQIRTYWPTDLKTSNSLERSCTFTLWACRKISCYWICLMTLTYNVIVSQLADPIWLTKRKGCVNRKLLSKRAKYQTHLKVKHLMQTKMRSPPRRKYISVQRAQLYFAYIKMIKCLLKLLKHNLH